MPKAIVGLGNPGAEYERTRDNAGWILLDWGRRPGVDKRVPYALCAAVAVACLIGAVVFSSGYTPA